MPFDRLSYSREVGDIGLVRLLIENPTAPLQLIVTIDVHWQPDNNDMKAAALQIMKTLHEQPQEIHPALTLVPSHTIPGRYYVYDIMRGGTPWQSKDVSLRSMPMFDGVFKAAVHWLEKCAISLDRLALQLN